MAGLFTSFSILSAFTPTDLSCPVVSILDSDTFKFCTTIALNASTSRSPNYPHVMMGGPVPLSVIWSQ